MNSLRELRIYLCCWAMQMRSGLKKIWRKQPAKEAHDIRRLVYRAIAFLDDATQLEILEQIYQNIRAEDENEVSEFYWTMRSMTGAKMLGFRKRIRDEVGMQNLR